MYHRGAVSERFKFAVLIGCMGAACDLQGPNDVEDRDLVLEDDDDLDLVDEERANEPAPAHQRPGELLAPPDPVFADGFDSFNCGYARNTTTTTQSVRALCGYSNGYRPVSGGCYSDSTATLIRSYPDEGDGNAVDDGDNWSVGQGWGCRYSATPGVGQSHSAFALCCGP